MLCCKRSLQLSKYVVWTITCSKFYQHKSSKLKYLRTGWYLRGKGWIFPLTGFCLPTHLLGTFIRSEFYTKQLTEVAGIRKQLGVWRKNFCTRMTVHHQSVHNTRPSCVTISVASSATSWRGLQTRSTHVCQRSQRIIIRQHRVMPRACCMNCQKWPSTRSWTWNGPCLPSRRLSTSCLPSCWSLLSVSRRRSSPDWRICLSAVAFFHQH